MTKRQIGKLWRQWKETVEPMMGVTFGEGEWTLIKVGFEAGIKELERAAVDRR